MGKRRNQTDEEIIAGIQAGGKAGRLAVEALYRQNFHLQYAKIIRRLRLSKEDALHAYGMAITRINTSIIRNQFEQKSTLATYLFTTFYRTCVDIFRSDPSNSKDHVPLDEVDTALKADDLQENTEIRDLLSMAHDLLGKLGESCRKILLMSFYEGYSAQEIADAIGFANARSVTAKKYTCLQQLAELMKRPDKPDA
ncbi:MAG: hypothetical protein OHK0039_18680 [Bacteroidia bacterium]